MLQGTQPDGCDMCAYLMSALRQETPSLAASVFALRDKHDEDSRALYQKC